MEMARQQVRVEEAIKFVAVYLRKSRGMSDVEDDLEKHRKSIQEICESYNWSYVYYEEIKSGSDIDSRPKMKQLLKDVKEEMYDAVVVFDYDRLGRGGSGDEERINRILKHSNTYLITVNPYKVYDMNDDSDETMTIVNSFVAKMEYRQITKRLSSGKKIGLRMGNWVHGSVPYGYEYNPKLKKLQVVQEEKEHIRLMVDKYLEGYSTVDICWELNRKKIPSPRGTLWKPLTISRIFKSLVYTGAVVGNKSEGNKTKTKTSVSKPYKELPKSEWVIVENRHEAIITKEEHQKILKRLENGSRTGFKSKINTFTSLIKCGNCGNTMHHKTVSGGKDGLARCKCGNIGGLLEPVEVAIYESVLQLKDKLENVQVEDIQEQKEVQLSKEITELEREAEKQEIALERIEEAFEAGLYDIQKTKRKTEERQQEQWKIEKEISNLKKQLKAVGTHDNKERISKIELFLKDIKTENNSEKKNQIYKDIISEIIWVKESPSKLGITINFL